MKKIALICDFRESFPTKDTQGNILFNDHPRKESVEDVCKTLINMGYDCSIFGGVPELVKAYTGEIPLDRDAIYINMSDGLTQTYSRVQIPILCDMLNIKYSGSGPFEVALMTNKHYTKLAVQEQGVLCPNGIVITKDHFNAITYQNLKYPVMIKPNSEGSSVGITQENVCFSYENLVKRTKTLFNDFSEIVIEEYISGADATCFLLGNSDRYVLNEVLLVEHHSKLFFDREVIEMSDHAQKRTNYVMAENVLSSSVIEKIKQNTIVAANALNVRDIVRIDYRITNDNRIFFLEANTVPRVSDSSELGFICKSNHLSYPAILSQYVDSIIARINRG